MSDALPDPSLSPPEILGWLAAAATGRGRLPVPPVPQAQLLAHARAHGVAGLVAARVADETARADLGHPLWREQRRRMVAAELARHPAVDALLRALDAAGVRVLVLKGDALACTHYPEPWMRPRTDTDLWCAERDAARVRDVLRSRGYRPDVQVEGAGHYQFQWHRTGAGGLTHRVDVHLRLLNLSPLVDAISYDEALEHAVPVPALGGALALGAPHALFHACVHRIAHHDHSRSLLWIHDVHLLAGSLDGHGWDAFEALAARARARALCRASLDDAAAVFGTPVAPAVLARLGAARDEPSAALLGGLSEVARQWINLRHASGWRGRAGLARRHLFPPAAYMRERYGRPRARLQLPFLYAWRIVAGLPGWLRRR